MDPLQSLLSELSQAEAHQDQDAMRAARQKIVAHDADAPEAAEALVKLGLDSLFVGKDLPQCIALFEQATKARHPFWVQVARTSLALCYLQQKRGQKALFELRRVAYGKLPSAHSVTALTFMETIFMGDHKPDEALKVRQERQKQLQELLRGAGDPPDLTARDRAHYLHQLAMTYSAPQEKPQAQKALSEALGLGSQALGQELWQTVQLAALEEGIKGPRG